MIDLHLHLDGSMTEEEVISLAGESGEKLDVDDIGGALCVGENCSSLTEYLGKFSLPLRVLQTRENIARAVCSLVGRLRAQGLLYAEIRFAPQLHLGRGLTQAEVVESAIEGIELGFKRFKMRAQLILCCMRGNDKAANLETIKQAANALGCGVCAADLAGDEAGFATENFDYIFEVARELKVPLTIHAGEARGAESVEFAVKNGAVRIGHGIRAIYDCNVINLIKKRGVTLEFCITSNLQTKAANSLSEYPLKSFLGLGVPVTINTDNMTVSGTTLLKEYMLARKIGLGDEQLLSLALASADGAFLPDEEKEKLKFFIKREFFNWINKTGEHL